jgi:tetratricopeptide (TPR) repeat protein
MAWLLYNDARAAYHKQDYAAGDKALRQAAELDPSLRRDLSHRLTRGAELLRGKGSYPGNQRWRDAKAKLLEALELDPENQEAARQLALMGGSRENTP